MKRKLLFAAIFIASALGSNLFAQGTWTAPAAPGEDLSTLSESTDVFVYNIEADAIFSRGFNWLTMALADRPEGGDNAVPANRQKVQIRKDGNNIKIHWNDRGADVFFGQADNSDPGQMWTDLGNAGNRVIFTPEASANYPNAYTLTNVQHNKKVDVLWGRGGKLTLWDGQGFYDWAFLTGDAFTSGKVAQFKVRKAMWNLYQALDKVNAVSAYTDALNTALAVYTNADATTDDLRAAFRAMFLAVAGSIEDPVDVSYIFNHPDMSGDKTADGWSYSDFAFSAGECEKYHAEFTSTQTVNDAPNGLYEVVFTGIYRQDDGQNQAAPQLVVSNGASEWTANFPNMEQLGGKWNIGGNETGDWVNSSTGKKPKWMWSASDAQTLDDAAAIIESVKVKEHKLNVSFKVTGGNQWFNFQRLFVTYKGSINGALYKSLQAKISEAGDYTTANNGIIPQSFLTAISTAVSSAEGLTANSEEQDLTDALNAINDALTSAKSAPTTADLDILQATVTLAAADGVNTTEAQALIDNPTTASDVAAALSALRLARRVSNAETHSDVFTGNAPAAGDYYLYNVGTGRFFCGGDEWGAHAAIGFPGIIVTLEGDGTYKINTHLQNGDDNGNPKYYLNYGGYCDTWTDDTWSFVEVSTGVYNIARSSDNNLFLGYSTATYNRLDTDKSGADNPNNQWKLVTKADRDDLLATATQEAPQDASYLIKSPNFSQREDVSAWTFTNASIWGRGGNHPDFAIEAYDQTSATVEQTVTGLPAGTYELKVQAFYRDGNFATQESILNGGGDARQLATLYAGTKSALIQNVSGGTDKAPGIGRASTVGYMPDGIDDACLYFQSGLYWATLDEIVVGQDGTMTIGARKTEKLNNGDWMVLDNFRLIYKGSGIDLSGVKADLLAKIGDATALLNDLKLNLSFLATAKANGQNVYDNSADADEIVAATNALQTAINQANAATDLTIFKQTVAKAVPEGVTDVFTAVVENVTDGSTFAATVTAQLEAARIARKMNALRMPDIYTGSAPAAGKVYLFNVGTGMFLGAGSDWNTHAAVDQVGIEIEIVAADGGYSFKCAWGSFNDSPYVDTGANTVYTFQTVAGKENVYNILQGTDLLGWNPNGKTDGKKYWNSISNVAGADANDANYQWKIITPAERKALLATAANDHPVDVSYLINNPSHNRKAGYEMYTKVAPGGNGGTRVSSVDDNNGDRAADFGYEFWNVDNLEWSQQLTGLTPGTYEVAVQGYYREGNGDYQVGVVNNGGTLLRKAYLKANDETADLQNIAYCLDGVPGVGTAVSNNGAFPNWPREAFEYFETGYYWTSVQVTVGNDGNLKIGVYKDSKTDNDWIVLDNFRLRLLSADKASATVNITDAKYATFIAPFDVEIPDGVTASTAEIDTDGTTLKLTNLVETIPAHTAVILFSENTLTKEVNGVRVADRENLTTDVLTGTYEDMDAPVGSYVLQKQGTEVGFYLVGNAVTPTVRANRAYLTVPDNNANNVKAFILGESDADGIRSLENGAQGIHNGEIFNLAGQRMTKTQRGVNIVNRKKVVIK